MKLQNPILLFLFWNDRKSSARLFLLLISVLTVQSTCHLIWSYGTYGHNQTCRTLCALCTCLPIYNSTCNAMGFSWASCCHPSSVSIEKNITAVSHLSRCVNIDTWTVLSSTIWSVKKSVAWILVTNDSFFNPGPLWYSQVWIHFFFFTSKKFCEMAHPGHLWNDIPGYQYSHRTKSNQEESKL